LEEIATNECKRLKLPHQYLRYVKQRAAKKLRRLTQGTLVVSFEKGEALDDVTVRSERTRRLGRASHRSRIRAYKGRGFWASGSGGEGVIVHTNTAGGNISCYHDGALARLELVQDPIALVLLFVSVNGCNMLTYIQVNDLYNKKSTYRALANHLDEGIE